MIILGLRTDKPEAELYLYDGQKKLAGKKWQAHRELAETIHKEINKMLNLIQTSFFINVAIKPFLSCNSN